MSRLFVTALMIALPVTGPAFVPSVSAVTSESQTPARDRGVARIAGTVSDSAGMPISGAFVTLCLVMRSCQTATTDATGAFAFSALTEGLYSLRAAKPGYMRAEFGALRPEGDGTPIALASSQRLTDVMLTMTRTGSVSGIVRDVDGRPAAGIFVGLNRPNQPGEFGLEKTKADGTYRIDDVRTGEYYVVAGMMRNADSVPTFYPSSASAAQATTVKVKNSEERDHIDISLVRVSPTAIRGVIVDPSGMPARDVRLSIVPYSGFIGVNGCTAEPDGSFACLGVSPGRYALFPSTNRVEPSVSSRPIPEFKSPDALEARVELDVPLEGLSNVVLQLRRGVAFSGRVEFDRVKLPRPTSFEDFEIRLGRPGWKPYGAKVKEDGTFAWAGLPELLTLSASGPPGWRLRSATWQGKDLLETGLDLNDSTGDVTGVVLTYTDRPAGSIAGVVKSEGGSIDPVCTVIIFPTSSGPWPAFSPRIASDRPATNGKFEFRYLLPGDYYIATVRDLGDDDWRTPEFLRQLIARATRVTLREGEQLSITLKSPIENPSSSVRRVVDPLR